MSDSAGILFGLRRQYFSNRALKSYFFDLFFPGPYHYFTKEFYSGLSFRPGPGRLLEPIDNFQSLQTLFSSPLHKQVKDSCKLLPVGPSSGRHFEHLIGTEANLDSQQ